MGSNAIFLSKSRIVSTFFSIAQRPEHTAVNRVVIGSNPI